jgi:hypothetical protein
LQARFFGLGWAADGRWRAGLQTLVGTALGQDLVKHGLRRRPCAPHHVFRQLEPELGTAVVGCGLQTRRRLGRFLRRAHHNAAGFGDLARDARAARACEAQHARPLRVGPLPAQPLFPAPFHVGVVSQVVRVVKERRLDIGGARTPQHGPPQTWA